MEFLRSLNARLRARLRALMNRDADRELRDEIHFHIELETEKNIALGMTPAEARRVAIAHFGGVQRVREEHNDVRRLPWTEDLIADVKFALRSLRRTPGLAGAAVVTLALGIGANVAIFSAVNAVVLQPLPFPSSERLMTITEENPEKHWHLNWVAPANFFDWRAGVSDFQNAAAYTDRSGQAILTGVGEATPLSVVNVTGSFFATLGARPALGRTFTEEETWASSTGVAVLSNRLWRDRFGSDSAVVGRSITLDGRQYQVVGVMPASFGFPDGDVDVWRTFGFTPAARGQVSFRRAHWVRVVARLKPGATPEHANAQLQAVVNRLKVDYPETNQYMGAAMMPLHQYLIGDTRLPLVVLLVSVAFLLLIACANVGNLLLVQAAGREREAALRLALGAGRARLVRQALTESLVLSLVGGAVGLALGWAGTRALVALQPARMLSVTQFGVDGTVMWYVLLITLLSGLVFGVAPALWMRHRDPAESLKTGGRGNARGAHAKGWGGALVVGEVALALLMAVGAGLLTRSLWQMRHVDAGFDGHGVLAVEIGLSRQYDSVAKVQAFMSGLVDRVRAIPGVSGVALTSSPPLTGTSYTTDFIAEGRPANEYGTEIGHRTVSPDYFALMRVPLLHGRAFTAAERFGTPNVILINDALARSYFRGENPVGQRIAFDKVVTPQSQWYTILGVVGDERVEALDVPPRPEAIASAIQFPPNGTYLLLRGPGDGADLTTAVRNVLHDLDPSLALYSVRTMDGLRAQSMARARFLMTLLIVFAAIGLALSVVGVYGVLAHVSRNRTREMGIRIALGAGTSEVRWLVVRQGLELTFAGLAIGGGAALFATRAMTKLLFGVAPNDPLTLGAVVALLAGTSVLASWLPAVRASRADPSLALRAD